VRVKFDRIHAETDSRIDVLSPIVHEYQFACFKTTAVQK
jgi:hypothetical protein